MQAYEALIRSYAEAQPETFARQLEGLEHGEAAKVLEKLPPERAGRILERMNSSMGARVVEHVRREQAAALVRGLHPQAASALLRQMPVETREAVLERLPEPDARRLRDHLAYAPDTAGGMMTPGVLSLPVDLTVQEAIATLRKAPPETVFYLYVTGRDGKLVGVVGMRELLLAGPREPIASLVQGSVATVPAHTDREVVARIMDDRGLLALPVVDGASRLLGVVTHEQALEAAQEEAFEDLQKMAGAGGDERALSPLPTVVR